MPFFYAALVVMASATGCASSGPPQELQPLAAPSPPPSTSTSFTSFDVPAPEEGATPVERSFPPLPYAYDALEPHIDATTMEIHYSRHHRAYFDKFVAAVEGTDLAYLSLEEILSLPGELPPALRNNGGGTWNHDFFWNVMSPEGGGAPDGRLAEKIDASFGSFDAFQAEFEEAALTRFGSGWAWLVLDPDGGLFVTSTPNQDNPLMAIADRGGTPILGLDVWEHAYYLKYQNKRGQYTEAFWEVVDWPAVSARLDAALQD